MPAKTRVDLLQENIELLEREDEVMDILDDDALDSDAKLDRISDLFDEADGDGGDEVEEDTEED